MRRNTGETPVPLQTIACKQAPTSEPGKFILKANSNMMPTREPHDRRVLAVARLVRGGMAEPLVFASIP